MMLWILAGLALLIAALYVGRRLLIRGRYRVRESYLLDGKTQEVTLHFSSKLPKLFGHQGAYAGRGDLCFRSYPVGFPLQVAGVPPVQPDLVAHELYHDVDRIRRGWWGFWKRAWWMSLTKSYKDRPFEQEAIEAAPRIFYNRYPGVDATDLFARSQ